MSIFDGSFYSDILRRSRFANEALERASLWNKHLRPFEFSPAQIEVAQWQQAEASRAAIISNLDLVSRFPRVGDLVGTRFDFLSKQLITPSAMEYAQDQARLAQGFVLPQALQAFRTGEEPLYSKLLVADLLGVRNMDRHLEAFTRTSAFADQIGQSLRVDRDLVAATDAFALSSMPAFDTLAGYRDFLDAAGLILARWPRRRLLSRAEKRRRFKARLRDNVEPRHLKQAKSLVHRYELTLREILDAVMADTYGEDWAEMRLDLCDCRDLLGRWRSRGGDVLDHADYAHYGRIMSNPEHFTTIFEAGFDDPQALLTLMNNAGRLRAASHHGGQFTPDDLRELRITWRTIETGLLAFTEDYEVESWA
ncbi:MAG: hypothetical protein EOS21_32465 [Mesorhizobium sp.]|nr:MAG: hypothetical protein EOS21_32465 [Mesorhizobium sp.]